MNTRIIPIKVWLDGDLYRELAGHAAARKTDVGGLLARLAEASVKPKNRHTRITPEMCRTARDMRALGYTWHVIADHLGYTWHVIADHLGCSVNGIMLALKREDES